MGMDVRDSSTLTSSAECGRWEEVRGTKQTSLVEGVLRWYVRTFTCYIEITRLYPRPCIMRRQTVSRLLVVFAGTAGASRLGLVYRGLGKVIAVGGRSLS